MSRWIEKIIAVLVLASFFFLPQVSSAQRHFELTPALSVSEVYDDNIFLDETNEVSDYVTAVAPGISLSLLSQETDLELRYIPTFVRYDERDDLDTTRHSGTLTWSQDLARQLRVDLSDTYVKSEEPLEDFGDVQGLRRRRNKFWRNRGRASLSYLFGPENLATVGYGQSNVENEEAALDDGREQNPFGRIAYWFNVRNGIELRYEYTKANFYNDLVAPGDDYTGNGAEGRYINRFTEHSEIFFGYRYTDRRFDGATEDYMVHDGLIGYEHAFSPGFSISLAGGYFVRENEISDSQDGYTYEITIDKRLSKGRVSIGGSGGWGEAYLTAERIGFTRYWSANFVAEYQILEPVGVYADGSYRRDKDTLGREWRTLRGSGGIRMSFFRYFSLSVGYAYAERNDDIDTEDYQDNKVMATLTASKLFRW